MLALLLMDGLLFCVAPVQACGPSVNLGDTAVSFPASISVPINAPVGSVVATTTVPISGGAANTTYTDNCGNSGTIYWAINAIPIVANRIGSTSVPGIGYTSSVSGGGLPGPASMDSAINGPSLPNKSGANYFSSQIFVTVNLVITGPVGTGALSLNPTGSGVANVVGSYFAGGGGMSAFRVTSAKNATVIAAMGCTVSTSAIAVTLPMISTSSLSTIGATAGQTPVDITLSGAQAPKSKSP